MPFAPLPTTFLDRISELANSGAIILDMGCGGGDFARLISMKGIHLFGLDKNILAGKDGADLVGDAIIPPILPGSVDLIIASNLVRHLLPENPEATFLTDWQDLLKPGGQLVVFEDEPSEETPAVKNYRDVQLFLAKLVGSSRGPLISMKNFQLRCSHSAHGGPWHFTLEDNQLLADAGNILAFLGSSSGSLPQDVQNLVDRIKENGVAYGEYWCAKWERPMGNA